jgi:hypothetical protein
VPVGNIKGSKEEEVGRLDGVPYKSVRVEFFVKDNDETYDGEIWLITPLTAAKKNGAVLDAFLSQVCFERAGGSCNQRQ